MRTRAATPRRRPARRRDWMRISCGELERVDGHAEEQADFKRVDQMEHSRRIVPCVVVFGERLGPDEQNGCG